MSENKKTWSVAAEIRAEQKAALKDMSRKEKLNYFWEYYKMHTIATVIILCLFISIIHNVITNKPYSFYAIVLNAIELDSDVLGEEFSQFAGIDNTRYNCFIDTGHHLNTMDVSPYEMALVQRMMATVAAGHLDSVVTDGFTFIYFADNEFFTDLSTILSAEQLKLFEGNLYYIDKAHIERRNANTDIDSIMFMEVLDIEQQLKEVEKRRQPENMEKPIPVGIVLSDSAILQNSLLSDAVPVLGVIASSDRKEEAVKLAEFLW